MICNVATIKARINATTDPKIGVATATTMKAVKIFPHTFHKSALNVSVFLKTSIKILTPTCKGNIRKAYGQAQDTFAIVVQPPSTILSSIPVRSIIVCAAEPMAPTIKPISILIPTNATPNVIAADAPSLNFIRTIKPAMSIMKGTKTGAPKFKI